MFWVIKTEPALLGQFIYSRLYWSVQQRKEYKVPTVLVY